MRKSTLPSRFSKLLAVAVCSLVFVLLGVCTSASAQSFTFTTFEAPGASTTPSDSAQGTFAASINNSGVMTGLYVDARFGYRGYLRAPDGTFTTFDDVTGGCGGLNPTSMNNSGAITGYGCGSGGGVGFLRAPDGTITVFDFFDYPSGINDVGAITGSYGDVNSGFFSHGFLRAPDGTVTTFDAPGAGAGTVLDTTPRSINQTGAITGFYEDVNLVLHGFLRAPDGTFSTFDAPGTGCSAAPCFFQGTIPKSINASGAIAGSYIIDGSYAQHGFLRAPDGTLTTFDAPGASTAPYQGTGAVSINTSGAIAGYYIDGSNVQHGFLRAPDGTFTTLDAPGAPSTEPKSINQSGAIAGNYWDSSGVSHGFVAIPLHNSPHGHGRHHGRHDHDRD